MANLYTHMGRPLMDFSTTGPMYDRRQSSRSVVVDFANAENTTCVHV